MSRKVLLETTYQFTPSTKTIIIPRAIPRERLILITNVTTNQVIYNFSDPNLRATTYTVSAAVNNPSTTIVLNYNTATMSATDKLQFTFDEYGETFTPTEAYIDPVNKFRVSQPQALIDTDFEYGTQITKWENLTLVNNRPFAFSAGIPLSNVNAINLPTGSNTVTVTTSAAHGLAVGTPITVTDVFKSYANGNFTITSVPNTTSFTYISKAVNNTTLTALFDANKSQVFTGSFYAGAQIGGTPTYAFTTTRITVTTTIPHGLAIGNTIAVIGSTQVSANGTWVVVAIPSSTSFVYYSNSAPGATPSGGQIYVVPQGQVLHRPFDGGVIFSTNATANYETLIRQTRRYFRYQSGKGLQVSSGTILRPALQVDALTASGTTITVQTKEQHNILPGTTIIVSGANETAYNGTFTSVNITGTNTFQYTALSVPSTTIASGPAYVSISNWYGAVNRLGAFDFQNGLFFEYDGQQLFAVRRSSTFQLAGRVTATNGSHTIAATDTSAFPTFFAKQTAIGDFIVIRGMQYRITDIASDSSLSITPAYRGTTATNITVSKTEDLRIPQSQWNIDKMDGTGPSGYNIDLAKMQMFYIDYSWYGAGFIRWGFRGADGNVTYCHKLANNNVNAEAYMRSGNLPARYETQTQPPITALNATLSASDTIINVRSAAAFPPSGTLVIRNASTYEYVNYTGKTATSFTGVIRAQAGAVVNANIVNNSNSITVTSSAGIQIGQRVVNTNIPPGTFVVQITGTTIALSNAATGTATNSSTVFAQMGAAASAFTFNPLDPIAVELAFPTFAPTISHWGTSVMMDGRFDEDKSLIFTFGQTTGIVVGGNASRAILGIRVAPSVDNGRIGAFGARDLINRMQLTLRALDIAAIPSTGNANILVTAVLNGTPNVATAWQTATGNDTTRVNSSLAQIVNYSAANVSVSGGEVIGGFFVGSGALSLDLTQLRDLGNSVLGGGAANSNTQFFPDGPDTLTIVVQNLTATNCTVFGRLSWTEAQA